MFFDMFKKNRPTVSQTDTKLQQVVDLLFPQYEVRATKDGMKYSIDSSLDSNIDAVIADLQEGYVDEISINTLRGCVAKLYEIRDILRPHQVVDPEVERYILAVDRVDEIDVETIKPAED